MCVMTEMTHVPTVYHIPGDPWGIKSRTSHSIFSLISSTGFLSVSSRPCQMFSIHTIISIFDWWEFF